MTDRALLIGTNYEGTDYQLSGCVNDALDWMEMLARKGYAVSPLVASAASKDLILESIHRGVAELRWGDRFVVTYSGHGTYLPDYDGDEVDGYDEAWCPDDMQTAGLITDDDLAMAFEDARSGVGILVLSDSCYSGTMTRFVSKPPGKARFLHPSRIVSTLPRDLPDTTKPLRRSYTNRASLISGSSEFDVSYDAWFDGKANGAFTRMAIDTYRDGMSLAAWHRAIRTRLPGGGFDQEPQLLAASLYRRYLRAL